MLADFTFCHSLFSPTFLPLQGSPIIPKLSVVTAPDGRSPICHFATFPHTVWNHPLQGKPLTAPVCAFIFLLLFNNFLCFAPHSSYCEHNRKPAQACSSKADMRTDKAGI